MIVDDPWVDAGGPVGSTRDSRPTYRGCRSSVPVSSRRALYSSYVFSGSSTSSPSFPSSCSYSCGRYC